MFSVNHPTNRSICKYIQERNFISTYKSLTLFHSAFPPLIIQIHLKQHTQLILLNGGAGFPLSKILFRNLALEVSWLI